LTQKRKSAINILSTADYANTLGRLNVARLANVPKVVVDVAAVKSKELEASVGRKKMVNLARLVGQVFQHDDDVALQRLVLAVSQL
jgi:DNA mismatch repair protein MSH3